jgi:hypothetical protein
VQSRSTELGTLIGADGSVEAIKGEAVDGIAAGGFLSSTRDGVFFQA